ncbi:hypothetical protein GQR58_028196 [Nymphon striatum]|nr:hypothetical protein GQR58_028196 [Nymphon striatum]
MDAIDTIKILGSLLGNGALSKGSGGNVLGSILGSALGGAQNQQTQGGGALGDILGGLIGGNQRNTSGGGMADVLGGLLGGQQQQGGGLGDLLGSLAGGGQSGGGLGDLLGSLAGGHGSIDEAEQDKVVSKLGDVTQAEADFVRNEFRQPLDAAAFVRTIPRGMEQQIYAVSLMAIDLDSNKEAKYLDELARGLNIQPQLANQIHEQLGAPAIYS